MKRMLMTIASLLMLVVMAQAQDSEITWDTVETSFYELDGYTTAETALFNIALPSDWATTYAENIRLGYFIRGSEVYGGLSIEYDPTLTATAFQQNQFELGSDAITIDGIELFYRVGSTGNLIVHRYLGAGFAIYPSLSPYPDYTGDVLDDYELFANIVADIQLTPQTVINFIEANPQSIEDFLIVDVIVTDSDDVYQIVLANDGGWQANDSNITHPAYGTGAMQVVYRDDDASILDVFTNLYGVAPQRIDVDTVAGTIGNGGYAIVREIRDGVLLTLEMDEAIDEPIRLVSIIHDALPILTDPPNADNPPSLDDPIEPTPIINPFDTPDDETTENTPNQFTNENSNPTGNWLIVVDFITADGCPAGFSENIEQGIPPQTSQLYRNMQNLPILLFLFQAGRRTLTPIRHLPTCTKSLHIALYNRRF